MARVPKSALTPEAAALLFNRTDNFVCTLDLEGRFTSVNPAGETLTGYSARELIGRHATDVIAPGRRREAAEQFRRRLAGTMPDAPVETVLARKDGARIPISVSSAVIEADGAAAGVLGIVHDLSERNRVAEALLESERQFRGSFESAAIGMALVAPDGRFLEVNQALCDLVGYDQEDLLARTFQEITHPGDLELDLEHVRQLLAGELRSYQLEKRYVRADGREVWVQLSVSLVRASDGTPRHFVAQIQDVDARRRAVDELRRREAQLEEAQQLAKVGSWEQRFGEQTVAMSRELHRIYGLDDDAVITPELLAQRVHPADRDRVVATARRPPVRDQSVEVEFRIELDGEERWIYSRSEPVLEGGAVVGKRGIAQDITERRRAEARFLEAERRYRTLVEQLPLAIYIRPLDMDAANIYVSPQVEPMLGHPADAWLNDPTLLDRVLHPDDRDRVVEAGRRVRRGGPPVKDEYRYVKPDGSVVWVHDETHVVRDDEGEALYVQGFLRDITERKEAEQERDRLRDELHHAQRLEALGRLAGGVAHDFNNMLTAIRGYADLLAEELEPGSAEHATAFRILRAAEQAAELPRHLLAFARKDLFEPTMVDVNEVVASTGELLERVISGTITMTIETRASNAWTIADRAQLEHALVNLAFNASDAMPDGGRLAITTDTVTVEPDGGVSDDRAGSYVVVAFRDTGIGMDEPTRARAFEPFFTTKAQGKGTGLGLSGVYGAVTQAGGFVLIDSAPGEGTVVSLHLPLALDRADPARSAPDVPRRTVLLAEDEPLVRDLAEQVLLLHGFAVLAAADGATALDRYRVNRDAVTAVVTDLAMPNLGGRELVSRIRAGDPSLPVVFISGRHDETADTLQLNGRTALIEKPFAPQALIDTLQALLDAPAAPASDRTLVTCVVADDHPAVLDSVSRYLGARGFAVSGARDADEALRLIGDLRPHVAVIDATMRASGGADLAAAARKQSESTGILVYTGHNDRALADRAAAAGARGFVLKEAPLETLVAAIEAVAHGGSYIDPGIDASVPADTAPLTPREQEVLGLIADGLTNDRVAAALGISPETVQSHVRHAMVKLSAESRTEAVATALRRALIP